MPGKRVSKEEIQLVYAHHLKGKSAREIADMLSVKIRTVYNIIARAEKDGRLELKSSTGRPKKVTRTVETHILNTIDDKPHTSARELALQVGMDYGISVSHETIRNVLQKRKFSSRVVKKKPLLLVQNIEKRLKFATEHVSQHPDFWNDVVFSDEMKIMLYHNDGAADNVSRKLSVMVWGCMSSKGIGKIRIMDEPTTDEVYLDILKNELTASVRKFGFIDGENVNKFNYKYYQGNDNKHKSYLCRSWLLNNCTQVINTPAQNSDINPIENVWFHLKTKVGKRSPTNTNELIQFIQEEWVKIPLECDLPKLVYAMPRRLQAVIDAQGGHTDY